MGTNESGSSTPTSAKASALELSLDDSIALVALLGNILVVCTILFQRCLKTNYYFLVLHLAYCDTALALLNLLLVNLIQFHEGNRAQAFVFSLILSLTDVANLAELAVMMLIAVLRYKAVSQPFSARLTRTRLRHFVAAIYALAVAAGAISLLYDIFRTKLPAFFHKILPVVLYTTPYLTALISLPVLYARMCHLLHLHGKKVMRYNNLSQEQYDWKQVDLHYLSARQKRNRRTIGTSVVIVAFFLLFSLPNQVRVIDVRLAWFSPGFYKWSYTAYLLGVVTANPFVYAFCDTTILAGYRKSLRKLRGLCQRKPAPAPSQTNHSNFELTVIRSERDNE